MSFYPLAFVAERVGGARVEVANLTPPGVEPHDVELTARDTAAIADADLVVYLAGFAVAVDEAIDNEAGERAFDVAVAAELDLQLTPIEDGEEHADEAGADPHFWLDPTRLAGVGDALADRLGRLDPASSAAYSANAAALRADLELLDAEFTAGLAGCAGRALVTSHNGFGYLAERYGLVQVGIAGLTPDEEPSPGALAEVADYVEANGVTTIFSETLVSPEIAETIAAETDARTAVLDPLEGLAADAEGENYLAVMRSNLVALRAGLSC